MHSCNHIPILCNIYKTNNNKVMPCYVNIKQQPSQILHQNPTRGSSKTLSGTVSCQHHLICEEQCSLYPETWGRRRDVSDPDAEWSPSCRIIQIFLSYGTLMFVNSSLEGAGGITNTFLSHGHFNRTPVQIHWLSGCLKWVTTKHE